MKKIMLFLAAVAMAFSVNAAAIDWASGDMTSFGVASSDTGYIAGIYFYTLSGEVYTDVTASFGTDAQVSDTKASKKAAYGGTTADTMASGTYYAEIVLTRNSDGATLTSSKGAFVYDSTALSNMTLDFGDGTNLGGSSLWADSSWQTSGGGGGVPEPTSGLLLLIGGSLLALRRKQK